jgi:hypothetical protein
MLILRHWGAEQPIDFATQVHYNWDNEGYHGILNFAFLKETAYDFGQTCRGHCKT